MPPNERSSRQPRALGDSHYVLTTFSAANNQLESRLGQVEASALTLSEQSVIVDADLNGLYDHLIAPDRNLSTQGKMEEGALEAIDTWESTTKTLSQSLTSALAANGLLSRRNCWCNKYTGPLFSE